MMRDWIVGLKKGASQQQGGVDTALWESLEEETGTPVPSELRDLYEAMNGAIFAPDVELWSLREGERNLLEQSREPLPGFPDSGVWRFGSQGGGGQLFAARLQELADSDLSLPDWLAQAEDDRWVYGLHREGTDPRFYRSLEQLLGILVPPTQTEEFGDATYARALNVVQGALDGLEEDEGGSDAASDDGSDEDTEAPIKAPAPRSRKSAPKAKPVVEARPAPVAARAKAAPAKRSAVAKKGLAKKASAKKSAPVKRKVAAKNARPQKAAAKKKSARRSPARRPAARGAKVKAKKVAPKSASKRSSPRTPPRSSAKKRSGRGRR